MEDFDFTYELPNNFEKRIHQYLQQVSAIEVSNAFKLCTYEYDIVGLAYYAGLRGDNWNKKAVDFTFEGPSNAIRILKNAQVKLKSVTERALKPSESGLLVRNIYFFDEAISFSRLPLSNESRLNADISSAESVLDDLVQIGERFCVNASFDSESSENSINDYFRDMLFMKGYKEVKDQTRHGISIKGKDAAEVDILLTKNGKEIGIYEGLKLNCVEKDYIKTHIEKAIVNYNALGTATFIVAYVNSTNFESFWARYSLYLQNFDYELVIRSNYKVLAHPNAAIRLSTIILSRDGYDFPVYFIAAKVC